MGYTNISHGKPHKIHHFNNEIEQNDAIIIKLAQGKNRDSKSEDLS